MNDYVIGSAAILTAGPGASIAAATVHAQTEPSLAPCVRVAAIDFESNGANELTKLVVVVSGWNGRRMMQEYITPLISRGECTLADVFSELATVTGERDVHLFARWLPDEGLARQVRSAGATVIAHPLEAIRQVALISGQSYQRWPLPLRAA